MEREPLLQLDPRELTVFWWVMCGAVPAYAVAGVLLPRAADPPSLALSVGLWIAAAGVTVVERSLEPLLAGRTRVEVRYLLRWGLSEAVALIGLVLYCLGGTTMVFGVFLAWSLALHVGGRPPRVG